MLIRIIMAFFILFVVSFNAVAGEHSYTCTIMHVYELDNDGSLRSSDVEKQFKGKGFLISRVTGEIIGDVVPSLLSRSSKIIVKGNNDYPFKAVTDFGYQAQLVRTNGFFPEVKKSFFATSIGGAGFITGLCE